MNASTCNTPSAANQHALPIQHQPPTSSDAITIPSHPPPPSSSFTAPAHSRSFNPTKPAHSPSSPHAPAPSSASAAPAFLTAAVASHTMFKPIPQPIPHQLVQHPPPHPSSSCTTAAKPNTPSTVAFHHHQRAASQNAHIPIPSSSPITSDLAISKSPSPCPSPPPPHSPTKPRKRSGSISKRAKSASALASLPSSSPSLSSSLPPPQSPLLDERDANVELANALMRHDIQLALPHTSCLPDAIAALSPSYPATLFGGLSPDDEHVTVWEPKTGKTVAGNAAPYRRNLQAWLHAHAGWEEKADELKSSKRRSAARRSRIVANHFAAVCCYPAAVYLTLHAARHIGSVVDNADPTAPTDMMDGWSVDDFVKLQDSLAKYAQLLHQALGDAEGPVAAAGLPSGSKRAIDTVLNAVVDPAVWHNIAQDLGSDKHEATVVSCAYYMLLRGITKSLSELEAVVSAPPSAPENVANSSLPSSAPTPTTSPIAGSAAAVPPLTALPAHAGRIAQPPAFAPSCLITGPYSLCTKVEDGTSADKQEPSSVCRTVNKYEIPSAPRGAAGVLERSLRTPREPRVTVWNPTNGRTISGNAAPCRRNLDTWMKQHPGWVPKEEGQLSSSRRNRHKPTPKSSTSSLALPISCSAGGTRDYLLRAQPESPHFHDALEGLLVLSRSPHAGTIAPCRSLDGAGVGSTRRTPANVSMKAADGASRVHNHSSCINTSRDGAADMAAAQSQKKKDGNKEIEGNRTLDAMEDVENGAGSNDDAMEDDDEEEDEDDGYVPTSSVSNSSEDDDMSDDEERGDTDSDGATEEHGQSRAESDMEM